MSHILEFRMDMIANEIQNNNKRLCNSKKSSIASSKSSTTSPPSPQNNLNPSTLPIHNFEALQIPIPTLPMILTHSTNSGKVFGILNPGLGTKRFRPCRWLVDPRASDCGDVNTLWIKSAAVKDVRSRLRNARPSHRMIG